MSQKMWLESWLMSHDLTWLELVDSCHQPYFQGGPKPIYEAESPDELALVDAAYAYHVRLLKRTPTTVSVSLPGGGDGLVMDFDVLGSVQQSRLSSQIVSMLQFAASTISSQFSFQYSASRFLWQRILWQTAYCDSFDDHKIFKITISYCKIIGYFDNCLLWHFLLVPTVSQ